MSPAAESPEITARQLLQNALGLAHLGRRDEAITVLRELATLQPAHIPARTLLGVLLRENGDDEGALRELDAAAALTPLDARLQETRAGVLLALQRFTDAERAARIALSDDPRRPHALLHLGVALDAQQRAGEAVDAARHLLALHPRHVLARRVLLRNLLRQDATEQALNAARDAAVLGDEAVAQEIAVEFCAAAPLAHAAALLQDFTARWPNNYIFCLLYARRLHAAGRSSEALTWSERAHVLAPQAIEPVEMRAVTLLDRGDVDAGLALYRQLLARRDADADAASRYLILVHYDPAQDNAALFATHRDWTRRFVQPCGAPFRDNAVRDAERKLRVGWLSPRFGNGPVASFFTGLLAAFDRTHFEHRLVALRAVDDDATTRLRDLSDAWLELDDLDDDALLQRLRDEELDIVIDLAGHSTGNRLRVLAQRVAPIQLCWLDYFDTTAVDAMDGWITDSWLTPEDSPQRYTERVLRLASGRFCYAPPEHAPAPTRIGGDAPVFGSFNRLAKLNDAVLDAWCEILRRVPDAQLELGTQLLGDEVARARTVERFAQRGIDAARLRLRAQRSYAELLDAYRSIDIALDPFPFSGCTTTCDALWMGVPVIARSGETFVARQSASLLQRIGRTEWLARHDHAYVECAVALTRDIEHVRANRAALRELMRGKLCDAAAQAQEFAALLRRLWREHCEAAQ
jgi:protein O-GlcNAc transferase